MSSAEYSRGPICAAGRTKTRATIFEDCTTRDASPLRPVFVREIVDDTVFSRAITRERVPPGENCQWLRERERDKRKNSRARRRVSGGEGRKASRRDAKDRPRGASRSRNSSRSRSQRRRRRRRRERTVRGERQACTRDRESQQPATCDTLVYTHRRFWRARSTLAARCRRPIDADRSRPPRTTLTLTLITRNYVSSRTHAHAYV